MSLLDALQGMVGGQGATRGDATMDLVGGLIRRSGAAGGPVSGLEQDGLGSVKPSRIPGQLAGLASRTGV
ncbi:MAG TPA: hypothetical protein VFJ87_09050 [Rhodanobacteraceae bacterium]|jgi:hypothetical protein|nr:hypothetical protein [Rhodanobacteraceae bacterium]